MEDQKAKAPRTGETLTRMRNIVGISQDQMARELGISKTAVNARENEADVPESWFMQHKSTLMSVLADKAEELDTFD